MNLRIGELAKMFSCPPVTIRYYEKEGLLKEPRRTSGNYRLYGDEDIERLRFIVHCRRLGITLEEIRVLLSIRDDPARDCGYVHEMVEKHIAAVDERIASLILLKKDLVALSHVCTCGKKGNCSILRSIGAPDGCSSCQEMRAAREKAQDA